MHLGISRPEVLREFYSYILIESAISISSLNWVDIQKFYQLQYLYANKFLYDPNCPLWIHVTACNSFNVTHSASGRYKLFRMLHIFMSSDSVKNKAGFHFPIKYVTSTPFNSVQLWRPHKTDQVNFYNKFLNTLIVQMHICVLYSFQRQYHTLHLKSSRFQQLLSHH